MTIPTLASLVIRQTKEAIIQVGLNVAATLGLSTTTWSDGDPTLSLYSYLGEVLDPLEEMVVNWISSGFLDYAAARADEDDAAYDWLVLAAKQLYNYDAAEASYATSTVTLTNGGGGLYPIAIGDLTVKNTTTGKTYHNTEAVTLAIGPGTTVDVDVIADEPGTDSAASVDDIDAMVTSYIGVTVTASTVASATDAETPASIVAGCRNKLALMSPNGAADAYVYVATHEEFTGTPNVTRAQTIADSDTGDVTVYLAGPSGTVLEADRALVEAAILANCTPLCITPTVVSATAVPIAITYTLYVYQSIAKTTAEVAADVQTALEAMIAVRPIGGDGGKVYTTLVDSAIMSAAPGHAYRVVRTLPAADVTLTAGQVATLGTVIWTVTPVADP